MRVSQANKRCCRLAWRKVGREETFSIRPTYGCENQLFCFYRTAYRPAEPMGKRQLRKRQKFSHYFCQQPQTGECLCLEQQRKLHLRVLPEHTCVEYFYVTFPTNQAKQAELRAQFDKARVFVWLDSCCAKVSRSLAHSRNTFSSTTASMFSRKGCCRSCCLFIFLLLTFAMYWLSSI